MRPLYLAALLLLSASTLAAELPETDWLSLMPDADRKALEAMPEITHESPEGAGNFNAPGGLKQANKGLPEVMFSARTVAALNGKRLRLGGYPVPLQQNAQGQVTEFFLVPYAGACIHVPPPPPNQIVLVRYPQGLVIDDLYYPLWVSGRLQIESISNSLADAAYVMNEAEVRLVTEEDL